MRAQWNCESITATMSIEKRSLDIAGEDQDCVVVGPPPSPLELGLVCVIWMLVLFVVQIKLVSKSWYLFWSFPTFRHVILMPSLKFRPWVVFGMAKWSLQTSIWIVDFVLETLDNWALLKVVRGLIVGHVKFRALLYSSLLKMTFNMVLLLGGFINLKKSLSMFVFLKTIFVFF